MTHLSEFSNDLAGVVRQVAPAIVRVEARHWLPASGSIWSQDGILVTAHHAIEKDEAVMVGLADGRTLPASLVGRDPATDLAVLRIQAAGLASLELAPDDSVAVGNLALAVGRPGKNVQASLGLVSALEGPWRTPAGGPVDRYLFADLVMYPGFSGGPLIDATGRYLGTNTTGLLRDQVATLTPATVRRVVETLLAHGHMRRAYLGIGSQPVRLPASLVQGVSQETGLLINSVETDSPAEQGGLLVGDILIGIAGQALRQMDDLSACLNGIEPGKTAPVKLIRAGAALTLDLRLGEK